MHLSQGERPLSMDIYAERRQAMVATQIVQRGISDQAVLAALRTVPRHLFVQPGYIEFAYDDLPLSMYPSYSFYRGRT